MQIKLLIYSIIFSYSFLYASSSSLAVLCEKGIKNNPKIKSLSYRSSASKSYYDQSIDQYKPHLNISGQVNQQNYILTYPSGQQHLNGLSHQYQFSLTQPVYRAKLLNMMDDAKARITLAKLIEKDEKAKLITLILQNSFELVKLKKNIQILRQKKLLLAKALENIEEKHKLKLASKVERYQALAMLKQSKSDLVIAMKSYEQMLFNLRMLTKLDNVEQYTKSLNFNISAVQKAYRKADLRTLKKKYHNNTRIKLEQQTVKIAKLQIPIRNSGRAPNIDMVASYGDSGGTIDATIRQNDSRVMLTLNFPIYQGGYVDDSVEEARFLLLSAQSAAEDVEANIEISLEKRISDIQSGLESVRAEISAVEASKKYFDAAIDAYKNGMNSLTDAYLAEADYHDNRLRLVNAEANVFQALAEIYYYTGQTNYMQIKKLQKKYLK